MSVQAKDFVDRSKLDAHVRAYEPEFVDATEEDFQRLQLKAGKTIWGATVRIVESYE